MSITDELRGFANSGMSAMECSAYSDKLIAIADRIDAEHEEALSQAYMDVSDSEWVRLPKDADGEPIRVGDVLTDDAEFRSEGKVVRLMLEGEDWFVGFDRGAGWAELSIHEWHHYYAPTVEDVLREFGIDWEYESDCEDRAALLREYAAKLRLAEEDA